MNGTKAVSKQEIDNALITRHTPEVYNALKNARVAVAGLGGLGSNIALMLARAGVGTLHLIDFDRVDLTNLNRQQYYIPQLEMYKTEALEEQIMQINPYISVILDAKRVDEENCLELFKDDVYICEAFDNPEAKAMLVNILLSERNDTFIVSGSGMAGFEKSNSIVTRRVAKRLYICGDGVTEGHFGNGLMSPRVTICAAHQANTMLRLLLGKYDT